MYIHTYTYIKAVIKNTKVRKIYRAGLFKKTCEIPRLLPGKF